MVRKAQVAGLMAGAITEAGPKGGRDPESALLALLATGVGAGDAIREVLEAFSGADLEPWMVTEGLRALVGPPPGPGHPPATMPAVAAMGGLALGLAEACPDGGKAFRTGLAPYGVSPYSLYEWSFDELSDTVRAGWLGCWLGVPIGVEPNLCGSEREGRQRFDGDPVNPSPAFLAGLHTTEAVEVSGFGGEVLAGPRRVKELTLEDCPNLRELPVGLVVEGALTISNCPGLDAWEPPDGMVGGSVRRGGR
jgi:hypothetical protein